MKHIKLYEEFNLKGVKKYFTKELPEGEESRSIGRRMKDYFYDEVVEIPLMYTDIFRENLENTVEKGSRIAETLLEMENNQAHSFKITNIGVKDNRNITYVEAKDAENENPRRKSMTLESFAKMVLSHRRFTEKSYGIFVRKYSRDAEQVENYMF